MAGKKKLSDGWISRKKLKTSEKCTACDKLCNEIISCFGDYRAEFKNYHIERENPNSLFRYFDRVSFILRSGDKIYQSPLICGKCLDISDKDVKFFKESEFSLLVNNKLKYDARIPSNFIKIEEENKKKYNRNSKFA